MNLPLPPPRQAHFVGAHVEETPMDVTVVLHRETTTNPAFAAQVTGDCYQLQHGMSISGFAEFAKLVVQHNLKVSGLDATRRTVKVSATPQQLSDAFGVTLHRYQPADGGPEFVAATVPPTLPAGVMAVLGLDQRPVAAPYYKAASTALTSSTEAHFATHNNTYNPVDLGHLYNFPAGTTGKGQCIAIIELGGGYTQDNLDRYFAALGVISPNVKAVSVMGAGWRTGSDADGEVQLDIEVAGALAPDAQFVVYFAPNTDEGFHEAISMAAHNVQDPATVISISWGGPENAWSPSSIQAVHAALEDAKLLGIPVTVAAGDNGAADGERSGLHADFPSSSPAVISCGGTRLIATAEAIETESVWNDDNDGSGATGGGVSQVFSLPTWQANRHVPLPPGNGQGGRGVPDVSAVADPETGYYVVVNGQPQIVGGTSAVAPLWAALIARLQEAHGRLKSFDETLYTLPDTVFRDITQGDNDGYKAAAGWDPTTGLGSPNGEAILAALRAM